MGQCQHQFVLIPHENIADLLFVFFKEEKKTCDQFQGYVTKGKKQSVSVDQSQRVLKPAHANEGE